MRRIIVAAALAVSCTFSALAAKDVKLHSLMVIKDGKVIYERYENGHNASELHVLWSASKTFTTEAALGNDLSFEPGTKYYYNSTNTYLLSAIITRVCGLTVEEYLEPRLFKPLGIRNYIWEKSAKGLTVGGWGLFTTTENLGKMGLFYVQKGVWNGKRLLQESWFDRTAVPHIYQYQTSHKPDLMRAIWEFIYPAL